MGGKDLALELLDRFLQEAPTRLSQAQDALKSNDRKALEMHLHRLASDSGWLGAAQVQELAGKLENLAHKGDLEGMSASLDELGGLCYEVSQELERERIILLESS